MLTACVPLEKEATLAVPDSTMTEAMETPTPAKSIRALETSTETPSTAPSPAAAPALPLYMEGRDLQIFPDGGGWLDASFSDGTFPPAVQYKGLWHTKNGGTNWTNVLSPEFSKHSFRSVFIDSQHAWIYGDTFFERTTNGGETWEALDPKNIASVLSRYLYFEDADHGWMEFSDTSTGSTDITVKTTEDGGKTWILADLIAPYPEDQPWKYTIKITSLCDDRFYFSHQRQIIVYGTTSSCGNSAFGMDISTNLGQTWTNISMPLPTGSSKYKDKFPNVGIRPGALVFFNDRDGILLFTVYDPDTYLNTFDSETAIYHTHDGGMHWVPNKAALQNASALQTLSSQIFMIVCSSKLCVTRDGGQTWQTIPFDQGDPKNVSFMDPMVGIVLTQEKIPDTENYQSLLWKTRDGGAHWMQIPISPPGP